jgi:hypothetical protein
MPAGHERECPAGGHAGALKTRVIGKISDGAVVESDHLAKVHRTLVFVLAELPVDREQGIELQPLEYLDARERLRITHGLGIVHRGLDEVVDVKGFDIERFAHVGAAITQYPRDLGLVALRIELRLDGIGARGHQAERKERS